MDPKTKNLLIEALHWYTDTYPTCCARSPSELVSVVAQAREALNGLGEKSPDDETRLSRRVRDLERLLRSCEDELAAERMQADTLRRELQLRKKVQAETKADADRAWGIVAKQNEKIAAIRKAVGP